MSEKLNILVTSCGGDIGQSIGKILKSLGHVTFGRDISKKTPSKFIYDKFHVGLKVTNKEYLKMRHQEKKLIIEFLIIV